MGGRRYCLEAKSPNSILRRNRNCEWYFERAPSIIAEVQGSQKRTNYSLAKSSSKTISSFFHLTVFLDLTPTWRLKHVDARLRRRIRQIILLLLSLTEEKPQRTSENIVIVWEELWKAIDNQALSNRALELSLPVYSNDSRNPIWGGKKTIILRRTSSRLRIDDKNSKSGRLAASSFLFCRSGMVDI